MQTYGEQHGGYGGARRSPIGIGGTVAIHAIVVGIFLLIPRQVIDIVNPGSLDIYQVPADKPKADSQPVRKAGPRPLQRAEDARPFVRDPVPPTLAGDDTLLTLDPGTIGTLGGTGEGLDTGAGKPDPVLADPAPDPRYARDFQPAYPPSMQRAQREGKVTVRIRIGVDGRVIDVERLFATNDAFWETTERQALRKWRFRPATRDGVPVEGARIMTVHFRLD